MQAWHAFRQEVQALADQYTTFTSEFDELTRCSSDSLFVQKHLEALETSLQPALDEAADCLEGLQDAVNGDYAEQVRARDRSGPSYVRMVRLSYLMRHASSSGHSKLIRQSLSKDCVSC